MVIDRENRTAPAPTRRELRATEGLAASLLANREEVLSWKDENPLRLVAAAVLDVPRDELKGGRATKKSIREQVIPVVMDGDQVVPVVMGEDQVVPDVMDTIEEWEAWWDKNVKPTMGDSIHTEGLTVSLFRDREAVLRWKDENPLRLVAAAVADVPRSEMKGGRATKKSIGERLVPDLMETSRDWDNLWDKIRPALGESSHFDYDPENSRNGIRRRSSPSDIPPVSLSELAPTSVKSGGASKSSPSQTRFTEWVTWVQSDEPLAVPKGALPVGLSDFLPRQPDVLVPYFVDNLMRAIDEKIIDATPSSRPSPETTEKWLNLLVWSLARRAELQLPDDDRVSISRITVFCARLMGLKGELEPTTRSALGFIEKHVSESVANACDVADAILTASRAAPSDTTSLLEKIHASLSEPARKVLWQNMLNSPSGQISGWLNNRWLSMPSDSEKAEIVSHLLMLAREKDAIESLDSLLSDMWNMTGVDQRAQIFNPILMGWVLHQKLMPKVKGVLRKFAEEIGNDNAQTSENSIMRQWQETVKAASQNEIDRLRAEHRSEIAEKNRLISDVESEKERADKGKAYFQEKLREAASAASLRFNRDAIVALGEWWRDLPDSPSSPHPETRKVREKIEGALLDLGAAPFGQVGALVPFDLVSHEATPQPLQGALVKIIAPGVAHIRDEGKPRTMVKARVKAEEQA